MGFFSFGSHNYLKVAIQKVNRWWDSFHRVDAETNEFIEIDFGKIKVFLFGSPEIAEIQFMEKHKTNIISTVGCAWIKAGEAFESAEFEIWLPFSQLKNGEIFTNSWAIGHELQHCLNGATRLLKTKRHSNPDNSVSKSFYL